jgi:hypothetical protein
MYFVFGVVEQAKSLQVVEKVSAFATSLCLCLCHWLASPCPAACCHRSLIAQSSPEALRQRSNTRQNIAHLSFVSHTEEINPNHTQATHDDKINSEIDE